MTTEGRRIISHNETAGEMEVGYQHDPGPQWTVARLIEELRRHPPEMPVQVKFGIDGPDAKAEDAQPVIGVELGDVRHSLPGGRYEDRPTVSVVADYEAGEYIRYTRRGDGEYNELIRGLG